MISTAILLLALSVTPAQVPPQPPLVIPPRGFHAGVASWWAVNQWGAGPTWVEVTNPRGQRVRILSTPARP